MRMIMRVLDLAGGARYIDHTLRRRVEFAAAGVAQLVRASACHAEGRGFEPRLSRHSFQPMLVSGERFEPLPTIQFFSVGHP